MVFIKKHQLGNAAFYQILTPYKHVLLDCHALLLGVRHRQPSFASPPKPLRFIVKKLQHVGSIFVSTSRSIGCLFVKPGIKIYCTKPVYDQILLAYFSYKNASVTYDDPVITDLIQEGTTAEQYEIFTIDDISISEFDKNVVFIKYGQPIALNTTSIVAVPAGTSIGWANYHVLFPDQTTLLYITSYSHRRRFSITPPPIDSTYLILNRPPLDTTNNLVQFTEFLEKYQKICGKRQEQAQTIVIPISIHTIFIEVLFHVLSVLEYSQLPIYIVSPVFRRLELLINIQSEWLNSDFLSIAEPFPIKEYKNLFVFDDFFNQFLEEPKIIFCDFLEYKIFENSKIFKGQAEVIVGDGRDFLNDEFTEHSFYRSVSDKFVIKMESSSPEILEGYAGTVLDRDFYVISTEPEYKLVTVDGGVTIINDHLFISGALFHSDCEDGTVQKFVVKDGACWLKALVEKSTCSISGEWVVLTERRIKFRYLNDNQIECECF